ncbi:MAG: HlyC/CorC family transporter [Phycisphaerales bacterium]|nr:HlyC/CorC family transporter [Phycisphaerales bacterium]
MELAIGIGLVVLTAYFSSLSYALRGYYRARLAEKLTPERQRLWLDRLDRNERGLQTVTSIVRTISLVSMAAWVFYAELRGEVGPIDTLALLKPAGIVLALLLLTAVGLPHSIASHAGESLLARNLPLIWGLWYVLYPVERVLAFVDFIVRRLAGKPEISGDDATLLIEEEIRNAVSEGEMHGAVDEEQKGIIESVFELHETTVSAIMTPRTEIEAVRADASYEDVRESILRVGHSRIPVYEKTVDHIIGVLYAKDLLRLRPGDPFDARKVMRVVPYVPETKTLAELLDEFRRRRIQIAIVLDEYGGTAGLATIEDILEELVGEIDDEYDQPEAPQIRRISQDVLEVDARVSVSEINAELDVSIPEDGEYETIGGFLFTTVGKIPARGETFTHGNIEFRVVDAEPRKINRLRIQVNREAPTA